MLYSWIAPVLAPLRSAARAVLIDTAVLSLTALLILIGGGFWLAAGFGMLMRDFGVEGALMLCGLVLWSLALMLVLVRVLMQRARPPAPAPASPDPMIQLVFDLCVMVGRALPSKRR